MFWLLRSTMILSLLVTACSTIPVGSSDSAAATCGGQGLPCCSPPGGNGSPTCDVGLTCDGLAWQATCGAIGGLHQRCDATSSCFQPHVCMTTDGAAQECLDPIGGGLSCGNDGQACCAEPNYAVENGAGPAIWCHVGLRCNDRRRCAP
jgi:hypothetical protein